MDFQLTENITPKLLEIQDKKCLINSEIGIQEFLVSFFKKNNVVIKNNIILQFINFFKVLYQDNHILVNLNALIQSSSTALQNTPQNIPNALSKVNPSTMFTGKLSSKIVNQIRKIDIHFTHKRNISFDELFKQSGYN